MFLCSFFNWIYVCSCLPQMELWWQPVQRVICIYGLTGLQYQTTRPNPTQPSPIDCVHDMFCSLLKFFWPNQQKCPSVATGEKKSHVVSPISMSRDPQIHVMYFNTEPHLCCRLFFFWPLPIVLVVSTQSQYIWTWSIPSSATTWPAHPAPPCLTSLEKFLEG